MMKNTQSRNTLAALILFTCICLLGYQAKFDISEDVARFSPPEAVGKLPYIAIGGGITTIRVKDLTNSTVNKLAFIHTFLPSFCVTVSNGYHYHFYLGYDNNDAFFIHEHNRKAFEKYTLEFCDRHCPNASTYDITLVLCNHSKSPAWAQNDAMFEGYLDGADHFYRINDDTKMVTKGWTETFIKVLSDYDPPNVGVVGPVLWKKREGCLTYDFTHRTHVDIFGLYYPRMFPEWYADVWITRVYSPERMTQLESVKLHHTRTMGRRYQVKNKFAKDNRDNEVKIQKRTIAR